MPFFCPDCETSNLAIWLSIELPPDSWWDEISLQIVECSRCGFKGAAIYQESRRGSLDSEAVKHVGLKLDQQHLKARIEAISACPAPNDIKCKCPAHLTLGETDESGGWIGVDGKTGEFFMRFNPE